MSEKKVTVLRKRDIFGGIAIIALIAMICSCWTINRELCYEVQNLREEKEQLKSEDTDDEVKNLMVSREELGEMNKNLQESNYQLKKENAELLEIKKRYNDYRDFLLKELCLIELKEEIPADEKNSDFLLLTPIEESFILFQPKFDNWQDALIKGVPALLYYPEADTEKVKLHFKMQLPPKQVDEKFPEIELIPYENWTLNCQGPKSTDVQLEKDENNPNYYYMILDERGLYRFWITHEDGSESYFYLRW